MSIILKSLNLDLNNFHSVIPRMSGYCQLKYSNIVKYVCTSYISNTREIRRYKSNENSVNNNRIYIPQINMPKKFVGENSKAVAARARKAAAKEAETVKKAKEAEDKAWEDNDKQVLKKKQKQEEVEKKRQQQLEKKAEAKALLEKEMANIKVGGKQPASKITRAEIVSITEKRNQVAMKKKEDEKPIEENLNRLILEGETAHGIDEAISVLSSKDPELDRHPEKRMKAAYASFEERTMPMIKEQNPTLRLSQLKQILRKEWMKSAENPLNQTLNR